MALSVFVVLCDGHALSRNTPLPLPEEPLEPPHRRAHPSSQLQSAFCLCGFSVCPYRMCAGVCNVWSLVPGFFPSRSIHVVECTGTSCPFKDKHCSVVDGAHLFIRPSVAGHSGHLPFWVSRAVSPGTASHLHTGHGQAQALRSLSLRLVGLFEVDVCRRRDQQLPGSRSFGHPFPVMGVCWPEVTSRGILCRQMRHPGSPWQVWLVEAVGTGKAELEH